MQTCSANSMKTYKYKQKQINYKGAKKAQGKQLQSAKHPNKDNYNQLRSPWENRHKAQQKISCKHKENN